MYRSKIPFTTGFKVVLKTEAENEFGGTDTTFSDVDFDFTLSFGLPSFNINGRFSKLHDWIQANLKPVGADAITTDIVNVNNLDVTSTELIQQIKNNLLLIMPVKSKIENIVSDDNNNDPSKDFWMNLVNNLHQHVQEASNQLSENEARKKVLNDQILPVIVAIELGLVTSLSIELEPNEHHFGDIFINNGELNLGIGSSGLQNIIFEASDNSITNISIGNIQYTDNNNNSITITGPTLINTNGKLKAKTAVPLDVKSNQNGDSVVITNIISETIIPESSSANPAFARYIDLSNIIISGSRTERRNAESTRNFEFPNGAPSTDIVIPESRITGPFNGNMTIIMLQFLNA